jgi:hypothetical protein
MTFKERINGKRRYVVIPAAILAIAGACVKFGALEAKVDYIDDKVELSCDDIKELEKTPLEVVAIKIEVKGIAERQERFDKRQMKMQENVEKILRAVR